MMLFLDQDRGDSWQTGRMPVIEGLEVMCSSFPILVV